MHTYTVTPKNSHSVKKFSGPFENCIPKFLLRRTIRVLNQSLWLKSLTARQRCLAGNANALPFLRNKSPHVPTPNLDDQPGMRDSKQLPKKSFSCSTLSVLNCHAIRRKPGCPSLDRGSREAEIGFEPQIIRQINSL
ncbi:hypothetical protein T265_02812 [Opisthorchis viverrini]|uniref:Uncharacterized protein n=1 Tax=Opisthorchis viverrini TaxID=6198 RepID=A0A074ZY25_OPIVI|nr:hypothetical protein T265_02812 [Opisthorchis viverrini]KER30887.1 hypothetical protein T265_02812 [Opisthorchis viverrini]